MSISDNGLGDVGISAYYSVRQNYQTNISLVNTSDTYVVAVKLRFHEAANSGDARDFNIYLSPNDVWVGVVGLNADGKTPYIQTSDTSCTVPNKFPAGTPNTPQKRQEGFVIVGKAPTGADIKQLDFSSLEAGGNIVHTQEGYVEVIEMGVALPVSTVNFDASELASWAVHGEDQNCDKIVNVYNGLQAVTVTGSAANPVTGLLLTCEQGSGLERDALAFGNQAFQAEFCEPLNVLKIASTMVRANTGQAFGVPVTTIANFISPLGGTEDPAAPDSADEMAEPSSAFPNLNNGAPALSVQTPSAGTQLLVGGTFERPVDAVGSLLTATSVINEYRAVASGSPQTAWVVTFPTKSFYAADGECFNVELTYYNREEKKTTGSVPPSPFVPGQSAICHETQTLNFSKNGTVLGSQFNSAFALESGYTQGWAELEFTEPLSIESIGGTIYDGYPTIGFALTAITNGAVNNALVSPHAYRRPITPP
jgi:hypothetical protein